MRIKLILLGLLLVTLGYSQTIQPATGIAKCYIPFYFTATGAHAPMNTGVVGYDNRQDGCANWVLYYSNVGFSAVSLLLESAPSAASNAPGTYVTFAGTIVTGANPATSTTQCGTTCLSTTGYYPWVRLTATLTGSGAVVGVLLGDPSPNAGASIPAVISGTIDSNLKQINGTTVSQGNGVTGLGSQRVTIASDNTAFSVNNNLATVGGTTVVNGGLAGSQSIGGTAAQGAAPTANPILIAGLTNGATGGLQSVQPICTQSAVINTSSSGLTQLVALAASQTIRVCHLTLVAATPVTVTLDYGTGSACGTGTTALTGAMTSIINLDIDYRGELRGASANALCINLGTGVSTQGVVTYAQF